MADTKQPAAKNASPVELSKVATIYQKDKYQPNSAIYPIDLLSDKNQYGDNYVVFYINVPENSKVLKDDPSLETARETVEVGSAIKATTGEIKQGKAAQFFGGMVKAASPVTGAIKSAVGLGNTEIGLRQTKRITDTITLNIPNNLVSRYSVNWEVEDLVLGSAAADITNALVGKGSALSSIGTAISAGANIALSKLPGGSTASAMTGIAANPKKEQLFKNVEFRTFNFEYQFAPRNFQESESVKKIIKTFKYHMHPEFADDKGYLFIYPSEFEIFYYQGDKENLELPRHTSCVLIDMSVNYTPQGMFNSFDNGAATLITLNLTFKELAILTKKEIEIGF